MASSRSAKTALPSEQNQPGRLLEQAAHPTGAGREPCVGRECVTAEVPKFAIFQPSS